jgi:hypothetical protein
LRVGLQVEGFSPFCWQEPSAYDFERAEAMRQQVLPLFAMKFIEEK